MLTGVFLVATWYARGLKQPDALTAASRNYPRGTMLCVHHGKKFVVVKVNDYVQEPSVDLDLSRGAFRALAPLEHGKIKVRVHLYKEAHHGPAHPQDQGR